MSRIPQYFIDDLLTRVDIVSVVDSRVKLKRSGKNYSACCPFHEEKTPSFTVSPDKQFYYCFGCGATGNAIGFVMEYERQGFVDAVENLAKTVGLEVPREERSQALIKHESRRKRLLEILEEANGFYQAQLKQHPQRRQAVDYLKSRGLSGQIARDFGLGFAPPGRDALLNRLGTNEDNIGLLIDSGMVINKAEENRRYDRFRHRITFPILDERGRTIGFGGRVLGNDKPKYLNSPETEVFQKGRELYGLYQARQLNRQLDSLVVVEGYMDVIALAQYGITNAVATLGTACGEEHLRLAFRFVEEVIFCFDGDAAGRTAAKRALMNSLSSMEDGRQIKFLFLPEGQDPDSLVRQIGSERFNAQLAQAVPLEEFLFDVAADGININTMDGRARFSKIAAPLIGEIPEGIFRELMYDNLARRTGLTREVLNELQSQKISLLEANENKAETDTQGKAPAPQETRRRPQPRSSTITLNPATRATLLLLETPALLAQLARVPQFDEEDPADCRRLGDIIDYLRKRPESNFNNIIGYWGGAKGLEEQQRLARLMANQLFNTARSVEQNYNPLRELQDCLDELAKSRAKASAEGELARLKARGLENLTTEEKNRLIELIAAKPA